MCIYIYMCIYGKRVFDISVCVYIYIYMSRIACSITLNICTYIHEKKSVLCADIPGVVEQTGPGG